jgi:glycosyltransferase involved in cell wall biosynthesis
MRIGIDARMADWGGVGRYTCNLLRTLSLIDNKNKYILLCNKENAHLLPEAPNFNKKFVNLSVFSLVSQFSWYSVFKTEELDVFHAPHFITPTMANCPIVVTIHDLIPFLFPEDLPSQFARKYYKTLVLRGIKKAKSIVAVSGSTRNDLIKMVGAVPGKIKVIYEGANEKFRPISDKNLLASRKTACPPIGSTIGIPYDFNLFPQYSTCPILALIVSYSTISSSPRAIASISLPAKPP